MQDYPQSIDPELAEVYALAYPPPVSGSAESWADWLSTLPEDAYGWAARRFGDAWDVDPVAAYAEIVKAASSIVPGMGGIVDVVTDSGQGWDAVFDALEIDTGVPSLSEIGDVAESALSTGRWIAAAAVALAAAWILS